MTDIEAEPQDEPIAISAEDRDSLYVLPLAALNLDTKPLRTARLIKNSRILSVVELFREEGIGSGQLEIDHLYAQFGWSQRDKPPDLLLLRKLAELNSYDVYSLRMSLREQGISVQNMAALELSGQKKEELTKYMKAFTEPLIAKIYGGETIKLDNMDDVVGLFSDPDMGKVRKRLQAMAAELQIEVHEVPQFLEDFGDVFLSLSYYRSCMEQIEPMVDEFSRSIEEMKQSYQFKNNLSLMETCKLVDSTINNLLAAIGGRLETFERNTQDMWDDLSASRFREVKGMIQSYHTVIGGSLCALTVKMDAWAYQFPTREAGGPQKRAEFIMSEMKEGIDKIREIQGQDGK
jgi:hypothetical protein